MQNFIKAVSIPGEVSETIDDNVISAGQTWSSSQLAAISGLIMDNNDATNTIRPLILPPACKSENGSIFEVFFNNGWENTFAFNVDGLGDVSVKVYRGGEKVDLYEAGDKGTVLKMFYDGTDFVVIGNPIVKQNTSSTEGYTIYSDGRNESVEEYNLTLSSSYNNFYYGYKNLLKSPKSISIIKTSDNSSIRPLSCYVSKENDLCVCIPTSAVSSGFGVTVRCVYSE